MKGGRLGHVLQTSVQSIKNLFRGFEEGCPFKLREVHFLNTSYLLGVGLGK